MLSLRHFASTQLLRPLTTTVTSVQSKATLPDLSYDYNALEPVISAEIMQLHHSKHHQTYVNNYNVAEEKLAEAVSKGNRNFLQFLIALCEDFVKTLPSSKMTDLPPSYLFQQQILSHHPPIIIQIFQVMLQL